LVGGVGNPAVSYAVPPPDYFVDPTKLPFDALPGLPSQRWWGTHDGAGYRIEVPEDWNGELVLWAHGFAGNGLELTVGNHPLRAHLLSGGYAWAASSYRRNEYDVQAGVADTHALTTLFSGLVGRPTRTYLTGASMGGHITAAAIEQYPNAYDGAMPIRGVLGDYELFDYFLDFNAPAQQLATGTSTFPVDPATYLGTTVPAIKDGLSGGAWPAPVTPAAQQLKTLTMLRSGGVRPNFDSAWLFWNSIPGGFSGQPGTFLFDLGLGDGTLVGHPGVAVDNTDADYQLDLDPTLSPEEEAFNQAIVRVASDPQGRHPAGVANVPVVKGNPSIPVLNAARSRRPVRPVRHGDRLRAAGCGQRVADLVVQRAIRGVGHCNFTRLAAIHSLFGYLALQHPEHAASLQRVLAIPPKRAERRILTYLIEDEVDALLDACDQRTWTGRRDHAMFALTIQTGLRISELTGLTREDITLTTGANVHAIGKGRKERRTPLVSTTRAVLKAWLGEQPGDPTDPLFPTITGSRLSRDAVERRLAHHVSLAGARCPSIRTKQVTMHTQRHTAAMRLLLAGNDITVIALWLGHEQISTTNIYLHADMTHKQRAIDRTKPLAAKPGPYRPPDPLLAFLEGL
jgi:site-specific recombinase XerD